jgi:catechol 2,3-dioxygenase-like lactoylglutathione lyase family enzyme
MAYGATINSAVTFVQELDRSVSFYLEVLGLKLVSRDPTAALLISPAGSQLILRSIGSNAPHPLGAVGVQYVVWTAGGEDELSQCERVLRKRSAHLETRSGDGVTVVEGRDPDGVVVMVTYPGPDEVPLRELPARIYGW